VKEDEEEEKRIEKEGQIVHKDVWFMEQTIGNACGTVGVVHALANNESKLSFDEKSDFLTFLKKTKTMNPQVISQNFQRITGTSCCIGRSIKICCRSSGSGCRRFSSPILKNLGQTSTPAIEDDVNTHFVCLVHNNGHIYEL
jgi:ubiquitin carboxyl-terminal hydrolase L3